MMSKKDVWMDLDGDGEVTIKDIKMLLGRHEWLFVAGTLILIGSMANVLEYTNIDSDLFWAFAGAGMMLEYLDDIRRRRKIQ
tara:strand:- start:3069 stop:3314 length:246 start_codon:yes stop_codon:yes gene_type:complete